MIAIYFFVKVLEMITETTHKVKPLICNQTLNLNNGLGYFKNYSRLYQYGSWNIRCKLAS